jgi:hypothetical protein
MNQNSPYQNQTRPPQMTQYSVVDEWHQGLVVSTFAHPAAWQARSQVTWNMADTNLPATVYAVAFNPNGVESFEFLPIQAFYWLQSDYGFVPIGQRSHGLVCMPPRPAPDALANLIIPNFRGDRQNLRVTGVWPVSNLWQIFNDPPPQQQHEGLMARVEYEEQGRAVEEEFYGVCEWVPATGGALNWGFGRLFCFRAGRGQLDALRETFWQIARSLRPNPQWGQLYAQTARDLMAGVVRVNEGHHERFRQERLMSERNIAYNAQLNEQRTRQVNESIQRQQQLNQERSQSQYTRQEAFGDALVNRTAYYDPNNSAGNYHYEEGNPTYTYYSDRGGWYSTNDPSDDPNRHQDGNWYPAEQVKINR